MKVSEKWLREWVELDTSTEEIAHQLVMSGTELDGIEPIASAFTKVIVGQIKSLEKHPDADRLTVCQVDVANQNDEFIQIVTNATVKVGQKVPVATIGAELPEPDGKIFKIKKSKLRGVLSQGMFCGAETLGMADAAEGLLHIPEDAALGVSVREVIDLDDVVLDLDSTPNRADLLSVVGIARELGVVMQSPVKNLIIEPVEATIKDTLPVKISANDLCQRYAGRIIRDVNTQIETPKWMVEKLQRSDIQSLGVVVDITNFVMLELGQPMHGFDLDKLVGGIEVRKAKEGEKLTLLDGKEATLRADTLVIADDEKALALAGIMGGEASSINDNTTHVFLESAYFVPEKIMGKARTYGLHTDSSHRFERGVSPDLQVSAIERASQLILEICGGQPAIVSDVISNEKFLSRDTIRFEKSRIKRHLGIEVADDRVADIMSRLGCTVENIFENENISWNITPPLFRFDLSTQEDLIEEVARIYGYDNIPARLRPMQPRIAQKIETCVDEDILRNLLVARGYQEAITYSFVPPEMETLLSPEHPQIRLANPISDELSIMRSTLWSGLIPALDKNVKRQQSRVRLFETGLSFQQTSDGLIQRKKLAGVITGSLFLEQWHDDSRAVDFYDIKGDVEALLAEASDQTFEFVVSNHAALHPGQSVKIMSGDQVIGYCGALHPSLEKKLSLSQQVFVFELDLALMSDKKLPAYAQLSPYPSIRRDLALQLKDSVDYASIDKLLMKMRIDALVGHTIFDVYSGENVVSGQKSLALGLIFQDFSRTLEEQEVSGYIEEIVATLKDQLGAILRQ